MHLPCFAALSLALFLPFSSSLTAADFPTPYDTEKGAPMSAEEAAATMELPPGFKCQVFAAEPDVRQPIAMAWDAKGRLWVAENYTYAENPMRWDTKLRDRLVVFEDKDGDGRHDGRKVFWENGSYLTSVELGYGGVWVLHNGTLSFIADKNGDDAPDGEPEVLLDGFNVKTIGHNIVNGLRWGPDGWLYGRHGITDTSAIGAPGTPLEERIKINCGIWRYHPTRKVFEVVCHGGTNSWGHDWNEHGELFYINTVIGHLWHVIPGAYYRRMFGAHLNPHVYEVIEQTADHFHWDTGAEKWSDIRQLGITSKTDALGGGHAHVGMLIYQGGTWPKEYHGAVLTCNLHGNRINMDTLHREGCGYTGKHAPDFMKAKDKWFRGIELVTGPDGNVFVADWSDSGECHDNDGVHRSSGRIYKIVYGEPTKGVRNPNNNWWTRLELQQSHENGQSPPIRPVSKMADANHADGLVRLHAASDLQRLPLAARWPIATALAQHGKDANDRQQPLMIWYGIEPAVAAFPDKALELIASAKIPTVRRLVARRLTEEIEKQPAVVDKLVSLIAKNEKVRDDILAGMAAALEGWSKAPKPKGWDEFVVRASARSESATDQEQANAQTANLRALSLVFGSGRAAEELVAIVQNAEGDASARRNAFESLLRNPKPEHFAIARGQINDKVLGLAARIGLAKFANADVPKTLLNNWPERSQEWRAANVSTLTSRAAWAKALLAYTEKNPAVREDISPFHARQIRNLGDAALNDSLTKIWGELRDTPAAKQEELTKWTKLLTPSVLAKADASKGRAIYASVCAACHKLYGQGGTIGPDLTGGNRHQLAYLLENLIDPNAVVPADFRVSVIKLKDGRVLTGVIPEQNERTITVQSQVERLVVERASIAEQSQLPLSLMPEGQLQALGEEQARNLIAYLMSKSQVELPK